uniref:Serine/threonine-protein kinase ATR n=1 Tax=Ciona intestinalis TaxID=7719 RepID=H2XN24_CIOIN
MKKLDIFRNKLLPRHPPVFHEWFLSTFTNPSSWYNARLAYARSLAVMSMVGYILGLGDRHGENILFDSKSGEAMHVDFSCLFNKGQTLDIPEIVPFRLTHNLVEAMGPTKYEGFFRRACEVTMNVLREQREPLMRRQLMKRNFVKCILDGLLLCELQY